VHATWPQPNQLYSLDDPEESHQLLPIPRYGDPLPSRELIAIGFEDGGSEILLCIAGDHMGEIWYLAGGEMRRPDDANPRVEWFKRRDMEKVSDGFENTSPRSDHLSYRNIQQAETVRVNEFETGIVGN
jgi:hypothetical protein